jgi:FkbM family methyltransferase
MLRLISYLFGLNHFLKKCKGVVHIGANRGQERHRYKKYNLNVLWFEPIPDVFFQLQNNILDFPRQIALPYLLTDKDDVDYQFNIASNGGASSSIFDFSEHRNIWPEVTFVDQINLKSKTLKTIFASGDALPSLYDALVIDTQGSELLVLKGVGDYLKDFKYVKVEASDFNSYDGCCTLAEIKKFMLSNGYKLYLKRSFMKKKNIGTYYDVVFKKVEVAN